MSPADGSEFPQGEIAARGLPCVSAILLHGGRALVLLEDANVAPPANGFLNRPGAQSRWSAHLWQAAEGAPWHGVALVETMPAVGDAILDAGGALHARIATAPLLDIAPEPLAALVRRTGGSSRAVFDFLSANLRPEAVADATTARAQQEFVRGFLMAVADQDGFIEVRSTPNTGGLFAQGWSLSLEAGQEMLAGIGAQPVAVPLAQFEREDILPPGKGVCLFLKPDVAAALGAAEAMFFEKGERLLRLDIIRGSAHLAGDEATGHVVHMLPRLAGPDSAIDAFKRIVRPRYAGVDSLSGTASPVAAAFDAVLQAPDGALLAMGWLLDPLRRVERVLVKSTGNLYARLDATWCRIARADLNTGFGTDPRFTGLLDERRVMHGFFCHAPAVHAQVDGHEVYLELVLDDGSCLFRPLTVNRFEDAERLPQLLGALSPRDPEIGRMVDDHLAPFLDSVAAIPRTAIGRGSRPIRLGQGVGSVAAVMPIKSFTEVQTVLALLAGTPEAEALDLMLVASRETAAGILARLEDAFVFFGAKGALLIAEGPLPASALLDLGASAVATRDLLYWMPCALPRQAGWLAKLQAEATAVGSGCLVSPALIHEDGSIYFGGEASAGQGNAVTTCGLAGYGVARLPRGVARRAPAGAAEIGLIDRAALARVGGFSGRLFSDAFAHLDLADRLREAGRDTWCSGAVDFWLLDDSPHQGAEPPLTQIVQSIDAALIGRRSPLSGEHTA